MPSAPPHSTRLRPLDGLRGLAALEVLVYHSMLLNPALAAYFQLGTQPPGGSAADTMIRSPLHLFMIGNEAVFVFFVLSGVVLTLQAQAPSFDWARYYPRRILRLYLPVLGSVAIAVVLALAFHHAAENPSYWVQISSFPHLSWHDILITAELLYGNPVLNGPLWSLRWEVLFSLALPLFVLIPRGGRPAAWITFAVAPLLTWLGLASGSVVLQFMPAFAVGVALVAFVRAPAVTEQTRRTDLGWAALTLAALALILARYELEPFVSELLRDLLSALVVPAAAILVLVAARWRAATFLLRSPVVQWLGRISFSLYLTHALVIAAFANVLADLPWQATALIAAPVAIGVAVLFERFVERPSHTLSRRVGAVRPEKVAR